MKKLYNVTLFDGFEAEAKGHPNFRTICLEAADVATEIWLNPDLPSEPYEVEEVMQL